MNRAALAIASVLWLCGDAAADPYGGGASAPRREGFAVGVSIGPAVFRGGGEFDRIQGVGGGGQIRVGTTAADNWLWLVEAETSGYLVNIEDESGTDSTYNFLTTLTLGAQWYVRDALWLRGGVGVARFGEREGRADGPIDQASRRGGAAFTGGAGYDLFRRGIFAVDFGGQLSVAAFGDGPIGRMTFHLGVNWY